MAGNQGGSVTQYVCHKAGWGYYSRSRRRGYFPEPTHKEVKRWKTRKGLQRWIDFRSTFPGVQKADYSIVEIEVAP
jgi:hypothetical protein